MQSMTTGLELTSAKCHFPVGRLSWIPMHSELPSREFVCLCAISTLQKGRQVLDAPCGTGKAAEFTGPRHGQCGTLCRRLERLTLWVSNGILLGLYRDNGKENGNYNRVI